MAQGRIYHAHKAKAALTVTQDLFSVLAGTDNPVLIHAFSVFQTSDVKDAEEEIMELLMIRGIGATTGSGGTTVAAATLNAGDAADSATVMMNNTTKMIAGGGSLVSLPSIGWMIRAPLFFVFPEALRPRVNPEDFWTINMPDAPSDSLTVGLSIWFEEL